MEVHRATRLLSCYGNKQGQSGSTVDPLIDVEDICGSLGSRYSARPRATASTPRERNCAGLKYGLSGCQRARGRYFRVARLFSNTIAVANDMFSQIVPADAPDASWRSGMVVPSMKSTEFDKLPRFRLGLEGLPIPLQRHFFIVCPSRRLSEFPLPAIIRRVAWPCTLAADRSLPFVAAAIDEARRHAGHQKRIAAAIGCRTFDHKAQPGAQSNLRKMVPVPNIMVPASRRVITRRCLLSFHAETKQRRYSGLRPTLRRLGHSTLAQYCHLVTV